MSLKVKKINDNAIIPKRGSKYAAGYDLYSCIDDCIVINPHETKCIGTGIAIELPKGYFGAVAARSGLASKKGLAPANKLGIIDSDYRGEVKIALHNHSSVTQIIKANERIAQLIIVPYSMIELEEVEELSNTERGDGGFGSTGGE